MGHIKNDMTQLPRVGKNTPGGYIDISPGVYPDERIFIHYAPSKLQ